METSGNPVIIDVFRKSGVVSLHHLRGNVGLHEKWLAQKEAPIRGGFGASRVPRWRNQCGSRDDPLLGGYRRHNQFD